MRWAGILVLAMSLPSAASAAKVVVHTTAGPGGGRITRSLVKVLKTELSGHKVIKKRRPRAWRRVDNVTEVLAAAANTAGAAAAVDSQVTKRDGRVLAILAVTPDGTAVAEVSVELPAKRAAARAAALQAARTLATQIMEHLAASAPAAPPTADSPQAPAPMAKAFNDDELEKMEPIEPLLDEGALARKPAEMEPEPQPPPPPTETERPIAIENPDFLAGTSVRLDDAAMLQLDATSKKRRRVRAGKRRLHLAARLGAGAAGYDDRIRTPIEGGNLVRRVTATFHTTIGLELLAFDWLEISLEGHRNAAAMKVRGLDDTVTASELGIMSLAGGTFTLGPVRLGLRAGASFDASMVDDTVDELVIPTWTRLLVLGGLTVGYGSHGDDGITAQLGAVYAPFGVYSEDPVTSGESPSYAGGFAWLRVRYQMPVLFGLSGGLFAEVAGTGEYLTATFSGTGSRTAPRTGIAVTDADQLRSGWTATLSVGYVY